MHDEWGIADGYHDVTGAWHATSDATRQLLRDAMGIPVPAPSLWFVPTGDTPRLVSRCRLVLENGDDLGETDALPADLPNGYHSLAPLDGSPTTHLIVHPRTCPPAPRAWGVTAQVYSLWRPDGWGIGDLRDVVDLANAVAAAGGRALLLSPLHAPGPGFPQQPSPYYPSSRQWLNPMLIPAAGEPPPSIDNAPGGRIDRDAAWRAKRHWLGARFASESDGPDWRNWARAQGHGLWSFCVWNALADEHGSNWQEWPANLRHPDSTAVADLPLADRAFAERCEFHAWCQWLAHRELAHAAAAAGLGLIGDLAVGSSPDGADAWIHQDLLALDVRIGAPPDSFNTDGQDWGLPPFVPSKLRASLYAPFIAVVRAALTGMAGLRIDHVMGLFRQYWVPRGCSPVEGAYVRMPTDELLAIICLECERAGAFVVGEDLGTVQPEVHTAMAACGMLGTKVWWFDQQVDRWPETSFASVTTHDLPTVAGVWDRTDGNAEMQVALRSAAPHAVDSDDAAVVVHAAITEARTRIRMASLDDLAGSTERPNVPGTWGPDASSWCVRMAATPAGIVESRLGRRIIEAMSLEQADEPDLAIR